MGLDTSHNAWNGPYSSFNRFREKLAKMIGIDLNQMEGFGGSNSWDKVNDGLVPLLNHSDCDGHLTPEESKMIADRLDELMPQITIDDAGDSDFYQKVLKFRNGCVKAFKKYEVIDFH